MKLQKDRVLLRNLYVIPVNVQKIKILYIAKEPWH